MKTWPKKIKREREKMHRLILTNASSLWETIIVVIKIIGFSIDKTIN